MRRRAARAGGKRPAATAPAPSSSQPPGSRSPLLQLPRPPPPGRMRRRSARVGFGCVVAAERSCEPGESEPGGEGWSLHGGEPEEPPPLPTPPPQPPPPPPRRPPPGADGLPRSRRGRTRTSGRRHTAQHGPGNQAPLGGQLTGERAGGEDHRAFQTVSDARPGAALPPRAPPPAPARCRPLLVRGTGEGTWAGLTDGRGSRGCPPLSAGVAASGLGGAGAAAASSLPRRRRLSLGLREAGAGKVPSRGPGSGGSRPCVRLPRLRAAAGPLARTASPGARSRPRSADARQCRRGLCAKGQVPQAREPRWVVSGPLGTGATPGSRTPRGSGARGVRAEGWALEGAGN